MATLALLAACGTGEVERPAEAPGASLAPPTHGALPELSVATGWQGELPCASCPALRVTLSLDPDGTFRREDAYLGLAPAGDTLFGELGRWTRTADGGHVTLFGGAEGPVRFAVDAAGGLRMLDRDGQEIVSALNYTLARLPAPLPLAGPLRLTGAFTYFADSALLVECQSGVQLPVAMTEGYRPLEAAYLARGLGGAPMRVRVRGRVEARPAMEGTGTEATLVVDQFEGEAPAALCPALDLRDALGSGTWRFTSLDGAPVTGGEATFSRDDASRISGNAGCNGYAGRGALRGSQLVTSEIALTRMFCDGAMELEGRVTALLEGGGWLRLEGDALVWHQGSAEKARLVRP